MKQIKSALPTDVVMQNILTAKKVDPQSINLQVSQDNNNTYTITTKNGIALVNAKAVYLHDAAHKVLEVIKYTGISYEFSGIAYIKHPNKEQVRMLQVACGFKKAKVEQPPTLAQQIQQMFPYKFRKDKDAQDKANRINELVDITKKLLTEFTVNIYLKNEVLYWQYYKGRGKNFHEGKCKVLTDTEEGEESVDNEFLLPMLQEAYGKPIQHIRCKTIIGLEQDCDKKYGVA